jgi:predicted nucleotidyltransferase
MRLDPKIISQLEAVLKKFNLRKAALYLYGSRLDDSLKGGDIDLLLICEDVENKKLALNLKYEILTAWKKAIGDRKIDFTIKSQSEIQQDPFWQDKIEPKGLIVKLD